MEASTRKATLADAVWVWWHMRDADRVEAAVVALPVPLLLTLIWGVLFTEVVALHAGGVPIALYGVRDRGNGAGLIWMLSTDDVAQYAREVFLFCRQYVDACAQRFAVLSNAVHVKNPTAVRFVERLGFHVGEPFTYRGEEFRPIVRFSCAD